MNRDRIGDLLGRMVRLTWHDVEEILDEQAATHRRFGEIAINWGLCDIEHVWNAWIAQLAQQSQQVDLAEIGVDCQALEVLPREMAERLCAIPVRALGDHVVLAVLEERAELVRQALPEELRQRVQFVFSDAAAICGAINRSYGVLQASA